LEETRRKKISRRGKKASLRSGTNKGRRAQERDQRLARAPQSERKKPTLKEHIT